MLIEIIFYKKNKKKKKNKSLSIFSVLSEHRELILIQFPHFKAWHIYIKYINKFL